MTKEALTMSQQEVDRVPVLQRTVETRGVSGGPVWGNYSKSTAPPMPGSRTERPPVLCSSSLTPPPVG